MSDTVQFLQALYQGADGYAEIRLLHKSGDYRKIEKIYRPANTIHTGNFDVLAEMNSDYHIYHRVNVSNGENSKKADISQIVALYLDIDDNSDEAYARLENLAVPTAVIKSGGGYHAYYMLIEPLAIDSPDMVLEVERTMQGMILAYGDGADDKAKDITRILRTPGFYNIKDKYDTPPLCELVYLDNDRYGRYSFSSLHSRFAHLGAPAKPKVRRQIPPSAYSNELPRWVNEYIQNGASQGERNAKLYAVARGFLDAGKTQFEAEQALISRALADGLTQSEANNTIKSAYRNNANPQVNRRMSSRYAIGDSFDD